MQRGEKIKNGPMSIVHNVSGLKREKWDVISAKCNGLVIPLTNRYENENNGVTSGKIYGLIS